MPNNSWDQLVAPHQVARGAAVNTFTSFRDVFGSTTNPLPTTGANDLFVGMKFVLEAIGEFSTAATAPSLQIGAIYNATVGAAGGTTLAQSAAITTGASAASWPWHYRVNGIITAVGSAGSMFIHGILDFGTSLTALSPNACPNTAAARLVTIDTTVSAKWSIGAAFGTSSASNSITVDIFNFQILNQGST